MAAIVGHGAAIAGGRETVWGTAVSRTVALDVLGVPNFRRIPTRVQIPTLGRAGDASSLHRAHIIGTIPSAWDFSHVGEYANGTVLWDAEAFGAQSTSGTATFAHTLTLANLKATALKGLTVEVQRGQTPGGTTYSEVFEGCLSQSVNWSISVGTPYLVCARSGVAQTAAARSTGVDLSSLFQATASDRVLFHQLNSGQLSFNSANYTGIRSLSWTLAVNLVERFELGSQLSIAPVTVEPSVELTAELEYQDDALYTAWLAGTQSNLAFGFTGVTSPNAFDVTLHNAMVTSYQESGGDKGPITRSVTWTAQNDGTDMGLKHVWTNGNTNYYDKG